MSNLSSELTVYINQWGPFDRENFIKQINGYIEANNELVELFKTEYDGLYNKRIKKVKPMDLEKKTDSQLISLHKYFMDSL